MRTVPAGQLEELARMCGFELSGAAAAVPAADSVWYRQWTAAGKSGSMTYLADRRGDMRADPRNLLPSARTVICVGKLYNTPQPYSTAFSDLERGWISRYAWGDDYHAVLCRKLDELVVLLQCRLGSNFEYKICVDTAPLLERSYARLAGLGWIGRNTCLINQLVGSWLFLGELLVSFDVEAGSPPPDRCGTCTRCIDACPTEAIVPLRSADISWYAIDARRCISYLTIELRGSIERELRAGVGTNIFGCDICQDVCPWNRRAPVTADPAFAARNFAPPLERLASISEQEFRDMFRASPVKRARYAGFLRNVVLAMANAPRPEYRAPLERLSAYPDPLVAEHARWALAKLSEQ